MSLTISWTPEQVEKRLIAWGLSCRFSDAERAQFAATPVVRDLGPGLACFPTPSQNSALTLSNLKACVGIDPRKQPCFFEHPWYENEPFMAAPCPPGWHFLTTDVLPGSIQQPVDYLRSLSAADLQLPLALEVILMLFLHYIDSGEQLLLKKHTWCADTASLGRHVTVGAFGRNGVFVSGHPSNFASRGLGVCAKLQAL
jgi:hypothetical protein